MTRLSRTQDNRSAWVRYRESVARLSASERQLVVVVIRCPVGVDVGVGVVGDRMVEIDEVEN